MHMLFASPVLTRPSHRNPLSPRKLHPLLEEKDLKNDRRKKYFFSTFAAHMTQIPTK